MTASQTNLEFYHVDAFSDSIFHGNPAAVIILDDWLPDMVMQAIAAEFNLSETTFTVNKNGNYRIRWFTPTTEVQLCGHATLATAHVLHNHLDVPRQTIRFQSLSGLISTTPEGEGYTLDFPANPAHPVAMPDGLRDALGGNPRETLLSDRLVVVYGDATEVTILEPDFAKIARLPFSSICVTAPSTDPDIDFVCRYFAPACGVNEDPVTGSAFTVLAPYYVSKMGKTAFSARQVSRRGGNVRVSMEGERVKITGRARTVMKGVFFLG